MNKEQFLAKLQIFANSLNNKISSDNEWNIKGFIDTSSNIYTISSDTKVISKILEIHLFPLLQDFASSINFKIELANCQNWYPDLTFISNADHNIKFALDLKTTYINEKNPNLCNGFTLGSHGEYFINRDSKKNIQYPYSQYMGHFILGVMYKRNIVDEFKIYNISELNKISSVIKDFIFFANEKYKIASDKSGSGNTANIGSIKNIQDLLDGNGVFSKAGESFFDDYWINFGKLQIVTNKGSNKKINSFKEYLKYRNLSLTLDNSNDKNN